MLNIGSKIYRNLPEQVAENMKQIGKIWEKLDGLDVYDNVIIIEDLDPLTPEQLEILVKPVSFIIYNNNVYMKRGVSGSDILFDKVYQVSVSSGTITFDSGEIIVSYPLGTLSTNSGTTQTYTTAKINDLLDLKADKSDTYTKSEVLNLCFPVNSLYISAVNSSPALIYGGTWTQIANGVKIAKSGDCNVKTGPDHGGNPDYVMKFWQTDGNAPENNGGAIGVLSNGLAYNGSASAGSGKYVHPINLWATPQEIDLLVYIWQRIA